VQKNTEYPIFARIELQERRIVMDEYISKQSVNDYLNGYLHSIGECGADSLLFDRGQRRALINAIQDISAIKGADVQPVKHGRWIIDYAEGRKIYHAHCSECGKEPTKNIGGDYYIDKLSDFCPNCGAMMGGDSE